MTTDQQVPIADGIFTWPSDAPQLVGGRCADCGVITFPRQSSCPRCASEQTRDELLARRGTLWTWTTQGFLPKWPYAGPETDTTFAAYVLGYVELPGQVKVEARLVDVDLSELHIGMEMELAIVPFRTDERGNEIVAFAFRPVDAGAGA